MNDRATNPFEAILTDYFNHKIDDLAWSRFQAVCDLQTIYPTERLAFAAYFADSISNKESLCLPKACEAEVLLEEIRVDEVGFAVGF